MATPEEAARREFLQAAVRNKPDDTFARYALAMELAQSAPLDAWSHFEYLLTHHPEYSATYYQAGMLLLREGRREKARDVLTRGVAVTARQGNQHAQRELQAALDELAES